MKNMNKSIGLLKSLMKKNFINKKQPMEINHSNRYSPTKNSKNQILPINKMNQANFNSNIEKKKNLYQQSIHRINKNNKHKSNQNNKMNLERFYKNSHILNDNKINNSNKIQNNSTINYSKRNLVIY